LAPRLLIALQNQQKQHWILGNFTESVDLYQIETQNQLQLVRDFGSGVPQPVIGDLVIILLATTVAIGFPLTALAPFAISSLPLSAVLVQHDQQIRLEDVDLANLQLTTSPSPDATNPGTQDGINKPYFGKNIAGYTLQPSD
jgi:hypothetical protein